MTVNSPPVKGSIYFENIDYSTRAEDTEWADLFVLLDSLTTKDSVYVKALTKTGAVNPFPPIEGEPAEDGGRPKRRPRRRKNKGNTFSEIQEVGASYELSASQGTELESDSTEYLLTNPISQELIIQES